MSDYIEDLASQDPRARFNAYRMLRDNYDIRVGEALVSALIREQAPSIWWLASICVFPIWLPAFDRAISQLSIWPFSGGRTLRIIELASGHTLHSARPHVDDWLIHPEWEYRFSAFRWFLVGGTMDQAATAAKMLLNDLPNFTVSEAALRQCSWLDEFDQMEQRKIELTSYLAEIS